MNIDITEEDFKEWTQHPVTRALIGRLRNQVEQYSLQLGVSAGLDSLQDRFLVGKIDTYLEVSNMTFEEMEITKDD